MEKTSRIVCIIQARISSNRLPGKVLKEICGQPMIHWVVKRAAKSKIINDFIVATTKDNADTPIVDWCLKNDVMCFRGDAFDVLDRYYQAAKGCQADVIVRLTADCPLIDPELMDELITIFFDKAVDFAANRLPPPYKRTYPIGLDVEVASFLALEKAWYNARLPFEREHVMPYLYTANDRFSTYIHNAEKDYGDHRWTVDTFEDLEFIRALLNLLNCQINFTWRDVLKTIEENPDLEQINAGINHKSYRDFDNRTSHKSRK